MNNLCVVTTKKLQDKIIGFTLSKMIIARTKIKMMNSWQGGSLGIFR